MGTRPCIIFVLELLGYMILAACRNPSSCSLYGASKSETCEIVQKGKRGTREVLWQRRRRNHISADAITLAQNNVNELVDYPKSSEFFTHSSPCISASLDKNSEVIVSVIGSV